MNQKLNSHWSQWGSARNSAQQRDLKSLDLNPTPDLQLLLEWQKRLAAILAAKWPAGSDVTAVAS